MTPLAPGVAYSEHELMPGRVVFACEPLRCTMVPDACADRYRGSQGHDPRFVGACRHCPIGAAHAGRPAPVAKRLLPQTGCSRCGRTDLRLVLKRLCVSCSNRDREFQAGKNAKGTRPTLHPGLHRLALAFTTADGQRQRQRLVRDVVSARELQYEVLRDATAAVVFEFTPDAHVLALGVFHE